MLNLINVSHTSILLALNNFLVYYDIFNVIYTSGILLEHKIHIIQISWSAINKLRTEITYENIKKETFTYSSLFITFSNSEVMLKY